MAEPMEPMKTEIDIKNISESAIFGPNKLRATLSINDQPVTTTTTTSNWKLGIMTAYTHQNHVTTMNAIHDCRNETDSMRNVVIDLRNEVIDLRNMIRNMANDMTRLFYNQHAQQKQHDDSEKNCCICLDNAIDAIFKPCNHVKACYDCGQTMKQCPICNNSVTDCEKVYL